MDHLKVLKRAWEITWRYRTLWVFGVLLALTTSRGGGNGGAQYNFSGDELAPLGGGRFSVPQLPPEITGQIVSALIAVGVALACFVLLLIVLFTVVRYVAETALIRLVDEHEATGEMRSVGQGFRLGWSRPAWRLFLIDLLIGLPLVVAFIFMFLVALAPLLLWTTGSDTAGALGTLATVGMVILFVLLAIAVGVVVALLLRFFHRACVLEELGVIDSIRRGFRMVREHVRDVAVMWLIMLGVGLGLALAMLVAVLLLIMLAAVLAGTPALLAGGLSSLFFRGRAAPWIVGAAVGIPIFFLALFVPTLFLSGLIEVFKSSVWTLTYRAVRALESAEPEPDAA
ncbi:MAG: hypothetical protein Kow0063_44600 [Anaerolineae bacterium]